MNPIVRILLGFAIIGAGMLLVVKSERVFRMVGRIPWAEKNIGPGGTRSFIKLIGVIVVFVGIATATNLISDVLNSFANLFAPDR